MHMGYIPRSSKYVVNSSFPESNATKSEKNKNIQIAFIFSCPPYIELSMLCGP